MIGSTSFASTDIRKNFLLAKVYWSRTATKKGVYNPLIVPLRGRWGVGLQVPTEYAVVISYHTSWRIRVSAELPTDSENRILFSDFVVATHPLHFFLCP